MTIIGALLDGPGRAVLWADSEAYGPDEATFPHAKLHANGTAACVGAGTGLSSIIRHADRALIEATDFDMAVSAIAKVLRSEAGRRVEELQQHRRDWFAEQAYVAVGYSPSAGRLLAWEMVGASFFVPVLGARIGLPHVPELDALRHGADMRAIAGVASAQLAVIRECHPNATGRALVVAEMAEGRITTWRLDDWLDLPHAEAEPAPERANVIEFAA